MFLVDNIISRFALLLHNQILGWTNNHRYILQVYFIEMEQFCRQPDANANISRARIIDLCIFPRDFLAFDRHSSKRLT